MMNHCPKTCNLCSQRGCKDEHENCQDWARAGNCFLSPLFMSHTCRESCGVCRYLAPWSSRPQVVHQDYLQSYTNMSDSYFDCGRGRRSRRNKRLVGGWMPTKHLPSVEYTRDVVGQHVANYQDISIVPDCIRTNTQYNLPAALQPHRDLIRYPVAV